MRRSKRRPSVRRNDQARRTSRPTNRGGQLYPTTRNNILGRMDNERKRQRRSDFFGCLAVALSLVALVYAGIVVIGWFYGWM